MNSCEKHFVVLLFVLATNATADDVVDFNRDIRPLLSENCFSCHGFDAQHREGDLRLDTFQDATKSGAVVPGDPAASQLLVRILSDDPDEIMPPEDTEKHLTQDEIQLIQKWIMQGAVYQEHWAWRALERPVIAHSDAGAVGGADAIDALLRAGWKAEDAEPVGRATPRERLRRLSFDLRGLLPTSEDVARFEENPTNEEFFEFRQRWMAELSYAEHQAVRWLDLVRWADTSGFVSDEPIASGAYRAWIISAMHRNQPFDQFSIEQLAGDLLPDTTEEQYVASGYNRIVNTNCEAGGIEEEQLYKLKGEHVRAIGTVWLGMTTGCAECHDHKFDPFSSEDYYSLAAFFDDLVEAGVYTPGDRREPLHYVYGDARSQDDAELASKIEQLRSQIVLTNPAHEPTEALYRETFSALKDQHSRSEFVWIPARLPAARVIEGEYSNLRVDGRAARETVAGPAELRRHHAAELMTGFLSSGGYETDPAKDAWFVDVWIDENNRPDMIGVQISNGRYGRVGWQGASYETYYWGNDTSGELANQQPWSDPARVKRLGDLPENSGWTRLKISYEQLIKPVNGKSFEKTGVAWLHSGGRVLWGDSGQELRTDKVTALKLGETAIRKWWELPFNRQYYERRFGLVASAFRTATEKRSELQHELVANALSELAQPKKMEQLRQLESQLFELRSQGMPVLVSRKASVRKRTRLLNRGDYQDTTGPIVSPAFPKLLTSSGNRSTTSGDAVGETLTRLDLAQWLFDEGSPLIARVYVNRLWHQYYGRGLSETLEDSGTQGDWPSNVALLDWLACEFRDSGWDRDHMVRLLTSTAAYQLSSKPSSDLSERDPTNRWHARQGRYRLTAEEIRDNALRVAGLLEKADEVPRHSFFPYQPSPYWTRSDKVMYGSRHLVWSTSQKRSQYLRSLYTFWKRQNIHPTMLAFDAPTRQECTAKRNITNTPGQALALLNDPIFVEAARTLAGRLTKIDGTTGERLDWMYRLAFQRLPTDEEREVLRELLNDQRATYEENQTDASKLMNNQELLPGAESNFVELAAWTAAARTVLNLHEFVSRQ